MRLLAWPPTHAARARAHQRPPRQERSRRVATLKHRTPCAAPATRSARAAPALAGVLHSLKPGRTHTAVLWSKRSRGHHAAGDCSSRRESDLRAVACDHNNDRSKHLARGMGRRATAQGGLLLLVLLCASTWHAIADDASTLETETGVCDALHLHPRTSAALTRTCNTVQLANARSWSRRSRRRSALRS